MTLQVKVQNGGLFISRSMGNYPELQLHCWEIIFVETGTLTIREGYTFSCVNTGESLLLWPQRLYIGVEQFPPDLKVYWLHFEVIVENIASIAGSLLATPQHGAGTDPALIC